MDCNQGEILEYAVRKSGYNMSYLAKALGINRRTLYNYFASKSLKPYVILEIGKVIKHDFSKEFPDLFEAYEFENLIIRNSDFFLGKDDEPLKTNWKNKFYELLTEYEQLL